MQIPMEANQVFALLRRNYRISRNTRALWQFQQIAASSSSSNEVRIPTSDEIVRDILSPQKLISLFSTPRRTPSRKSFFYQP